MLRWRKAIATPGHRGRDVAFWATQPLHRYRVLCVLIVLLCLPEIVLFLSDHAVLGSPRWRLLAYQYGAFWAGLLL